MALRQLSLADRILGEINRSINVLSVSTRAARARPQAPDGAVAADAPRDPDRIASLRLMRVNHAGEVAAQALYRGQALTARTAATSRMLHRAADEECDHLGWCESRIRELGGHTSVFNPAWYLGSFAIGVLAGSFGDEVSLGFVAETERQVEDHLREHLERLPAGDLGSRAIVRQMSEDERAHGLRATAQGGSPLPAPVRAIMRLTSRLMTRGSYWL